MDPNTYIGVPRVGRKPKYKTGPMSDETRKKEQRERQTARIVSGSTEQLTAADCLAILASPKWRAIAGRAAWYRLAKIYDYDDTNSNQR